ncbi:DnaB-like helicase C-terminal domain-containing protein [Rhodococcus sp. 5G237]
MIAYQRVIDAFRSQSLNVKETGQGKASAQAPGHSDADLSVSIKDIGDQVLIWSHSDPTESVLEALGLTLADLFDSPKGTEYQYGDGRVVRRTPQKKFSQGGNTKGTELYRADKVRATTDTVYIVEGEKDVHALESVGAVACCTAMGAGKAHMFDLTPLHGKTVVIVQDMDEPGRKHAQQLTELLDGHAQVSIVHPKTGKDAADHIAAGHALTDFTEAPSTSPKIRSALSRITEAAERLDGDELLAYAYQQLDALNTGKENPKMRKFGDILPEWWEWFDAPPDQIRTIPTPWDELNEILAGGLHPGRSYLIAGRPGGGKSLGLTNIAAHAAEQGHKGALFTVEMGRIEIMSRILAGQARAEYGQITKRNIDAHNLAKIAEYADGATDLPLWINDQASITVNQIRTQARELKSQQGLDFVAVDYVQLLKAADSRLTRERQIAEISWGLKTLSRELDVAVISACQLNRGAQKENRPPTIAELRESGSLEQDSDVVILLHHTTMEGHPTGEVEMIAGKNRTGPLSTVTLPWRAHYARIGR